MRKLICLAELVGDSTNFGFLDYKKGEKVLESLDYSLGSYGQMAPLLIYFKDGSAYHLQNNNYNAREIVDFIGNFTAECRWSEPIRRARNSANIFIEYACKDVAALPIVQ